MCVSMHGQKCLSSALKFSTISTHSPSACTSWFNSNNTQFFPCFHMCLWECIYAYMHVDISPPAYLMNALQIFHTPTRSTSIAYTCMCVYANKRFLQTVQRCEEASCNLRLLCEPFDMFVSLNIPVFLSLGRFSFHFLLHINTTNCKMHVKHHKLTT